jgi:hypothetical protein
MAVDGMTPWLARKMTLGCRGPGPRAFEALLTMTVRSPCVVLAHIWGSESPRTPVVD